MSTATATKIDRRNSRRKIQPFRMQKEHYSLFRLWFLKGFSSVLFLSVSFTACLMKNSTLMHIYTCVCVCMCKPYSLSMQFQLCWFVRSFASHKCALIFHLQKLWMCKCECYEQVWTSVCVCFWWILLYTYDGKNRQMIENCGKQKTEKIIDFHCVDIGKTNGQTFWGARARTFTFPSMLFAFDIKYA